VVGVLLLTQQPSSSTVLPQPTIGGIYTEALIGSFGRLNPLLDLDNSTDRDIDRLVFSGLFKFDSQGLPQPDLAESWGSTPDGKIYNITLRPNANWQDGSPVTSDDVMFTISLLRSQYSAYPADVRSLWDQVQITRLNDKNLKFTLTEPYAPFIDYLTFGILPKHLLQNVSADQLANAPFNLAPVGSGPYEFDHLTVENGKVTGVDLRISKNFYGKAPFIQQIVFRYYPNSAAALTAYHQGDVLGISQLDPGTLATVCAESSMNCYSSRLPRLSLIILNLNNSQLPFFQDKNIRQALLAGLNRQEMVDTILQGQAIVADSPILPDTWAYYDNISQTPFDADAAVQMLKAAGYVIPATGNVRMKDNTALSFTMVVPNDDLHTRLAQAIQADWAALGVQVNLQPVSYTSLVNDYLSPRSFQAALVDLDFTRSYDPDPYPFWHQAEATGGQNYSQWDDRAASEYLEEARVTADQNVRLRLYHNFQVVFSQETPALLLYYPVYTYGVDVRVQGVQMAPLYEPSDRFNSISDWYLVTSRALEQTKQPTPTSK